MQLQSQLVHAEPGQRVVLVSAWQQGACLGSALGEGGNAEQAEDRAIERLRARLPAATSSTTSFATTATTATTTAAAPVRVAPAPEPVPQPVPAPPPPLSSAEPPSPEPPGSSPPSPEPPRPEGPSPEDPPADPEDWSDELAEVDLQLRRLRWGREQEAIYLERVFGHPSRGRLVRYADLLSYRQALLQLEPGSDPAQARPPLRRPELLAQCDQLLGQLGWGAAQGREFLERHFSHTSRQQLSDQQLLHFNMLLEGVMIGEPPPPPPP
ncbi:hypothetical protein KQ313_00900 [Synechococcus sp. CS-1325]|uniref:hypothetical protein n=1 Tax=Synechococcus sp. CS-1325 TaxID=2847979 RepID=UPI00223B5545|nr:hypothetical protein [Synechococcus sp. CS-1325]MCT0198252.1 hypothetical protein [Synechococcus sp. CS-1325]